jgi:hypothetical protein
LHVINDLFVIFGRNPIENLIFGKAIKYANYKCWGERYKYFVEIIGLQYYIKGIINANG